MRSAGRTRAGALVEDVGVAFPREALVIVDLGELKQVALRDLRARVTVAVAPNHEPWQVQFAVFAPLAALRKRAVVFREIRLAPAPHRV